MSNNKPKIIQSHPLYESRLFAPIKVLPSSPPFRKSDHFIEKTFNKPPVTFAYPKRSIPIMSMTPKNIQQTPQIINENPNVQLKPLSFIETHNLHGYMRLPKIPHSEMPVENELEVGKEPLKQKENKKNLWPWLVAGLLGVLSLVFMILFLFCKISTNNRNLSSNQAMVPLNLSWSKNE